MEQLYSCRFTPVGKLFERMRAGESVAARAFVLARDGRPVSPPNELPWQALYRS